MRFAFIFTVGILLAGFATAEEFSVGSIKIKNPVSYPTIGRSGAGYMHIVNTGPADALIAVEADFPRVMMHNTITTDGVASMRHQMQVNVPANVTVVFAPGGLHVMFMGLSDHLMIGDEIPATLTFRDAGKVDVVFKVEKRPEAGMKMNTNSDHASHDHGAN